LKTKGGSNMSESGIFLKIELVGLGWRDASERDVLKEIAERIKVREGEFSGNMKNMNISIGRHLDKLHVVTDEFLTCFGIKEKLCTRDHFKIRKNSGPGKAERCPECARMCSFQKAASRCRFYFLLG